MGTPKVGDDERVQDLLEVRVVTEPRPFEPSAPCSAPAALVNQPTRTLRQLREDFGYSQNALAERLGTSQAAVLKTETASDPLLSTVRRYVQGVAGLRGDVGDLRIVAVMGVSETTVLLPDPAPARNTADTPVWRLRAWDDADLEDVWLADNMISISEDEIGDLTRWPGKREVAARLTEAMHARTRQAIGLFVTYWSYFAQEMAADDIVITPISGKRARIAKIAGPYRYNDDKNANPRLRHYRKVEWLGTVRRSNLPDDIRKVVNAPGTICRIAAPRAAERLTGALVGHKLDTNGFAPSGRRTTTRTQPGEKTWSQGSERTGQHCMDDRP